MGEAVTQQRDESPTGIVLAGGGARGAYEIGALSVLLPLLHERGELPEIYVGTSIGALHVAYLASRAGDPPATVIRDALERWNRWGLPNVLSSPLSPRQLRLIAQYVGGAVGLPVRPPPSLLATAPLERTIRELAALDEIHARRQRGVIRAAALVATSASTGRSVVFHDGGDPPRRDDRRGIEYVRTNLGTEHVRASSAIPSLFPAVHVTEPKEAEGWYVDGGTRLNTPIKPAIKLGAKRLVIVGLNSNRPESQRLPSKRPDAIDGASHVTQAILADPLQNDVQTLARQNELPQPVAESAGYSAIPYIFIAPDSRNRIGQLAAEVFLKHYAPRRWRSRRIRLLGRVVDGGRSPEHGELLSYLFFAPEFVDELVALGQQDAKGWLAMEHELGPWRLGPPPSQPPRETDG